MYKKYITAIAVLLTILLLATACSSADEATEQPYEETDIPVVTDIPATENPVIVDDASPACMSQLDTMLNDDEDSEVADNAPEVDDEYILVTYQVSGDEISSPKDEPGVPDELVEYQHDTKSQENMWKFVTDVIPADQRGMISEFIIFTDGYSNTVGAVDEADSPDSWTLELDIIDSRDLSTLSTTLIHEFGHMLTLNDRQLDGNTSSCTTYLSDDGCSKSDSYINAFYNAFWTDIYEEWSSTVETSDGESDEDQVQIFYEQYADQFVSDYAPTNPEEDIAESWLYFVFSARPAGGTVAEQKILFFYGYPELVELRQQILSSLCQYAQP